MPADFADTAQELQELILQQTMIEQKRKTQSPFSGFCLSCHEPVQERRYCDQYCREDHEKQMKRNR